MNLAQTLYILKESIIGFERLFNRFGPFEVRENMIAINEKGFCRVWLNENFADNNPALEKGILYTAETDKLNEVNTEGEMINNILKVVEDKCEEGKFPQKFSEIIYTQNNKFNDAIFTLNSYSLIGSDGASHNFIGKIHIPPFWSLGWHQCRWGYQNLSVF